MIEPSSQLTRSVSELVFSCEIAGTHWSQEKSLGFGRKGVVVGLKASVGLGQREILSQKDQSVSGFQPKN